MMKKDKTKPISYEAIIKNKTLKEFIKQDVVDKTKKVAQDTWNIIAKYTLQNRITKTKKRILQQK
jgi:hypothetical protein